MSSTPRSPLVQGVAATEMEKDKSMVPRTIGDYSPMKLGASTRAVAPDAPRLTPILPPETRRRLAELEAALLEAECQRDKAFAEWQASGDSTYLLRVYQANVDGVTALKDEINRVSGGAQS